MFTIKRSLDKLFWNNSYKFCFLNKYVYVLGWLIYISPTAKESLRGNNKKGFVVAFSTSCHLGFC